MTLYPADFEMLDAYLDNELIKEERLNFEARLSRDTELAEALAATQRFRIAWRSRLAQTQAPASLRASIQAALTGSAAQPGWPAWLTTWLTTPQTIKPYVAGAFAVVMIVLLAAILFWVGRMSSPEDQSIFRQIAGQHMAYLKGPALLLDVAGEPAEITAWFSEYVPFPVAVPTLADWRLEGGRLGEVHHQPAAHLIYDRSGKHVSLTLFSPQPTDFPAESRTRLNDDDFFVSQVGQQPVILWRIGQLGYALTTDADLSSAELLALAAELTSQLEPE